MTRSGSLFRKYVIYFVVLVSAALIASGAVGLYFTYQERKAALLDLQREKAGAAASRIDAYVQEIEHQVGWMRLPQTGASNLEQRRIDFLKLLRQVPAITDLRYLDRTGREQLKVSRLSMDVAGSRQDFSQDPKFTAAKSDGTYFSPVYFRKETEPYMTIAVAGTSEEVGITVAEVNLKFIWEVISRIKIGDQGLAYVVDSSGQLIAHPDISQVLQKLDLSGLRQVKAARDARPGDAAGRVAISSNLQGQEVLTAYASIAPLGWHVFVEQPLAEAFAPLYASLVRTGLLLVAGLMLAIFVSLYVARRMVTPIRAIRAGAAQFATGKLDQRIEVHTGDELEALASEFNDMAKQLQEFYESLERKVEERTRELRAALEQQTATAEILRVISSSPTDIQPVLDAVASTAARLCGAADAAIRRVDGDVLRLVAQYGSIPSLAGEEIPINPATVIGRSVLDRQTIHIDDIAGLRTTLATPLLREGQAIGAITVSRTEVRPFSDQQIKLLEIFADQAVIAIENVRLLQKLQARTRELGRSVEELRSLGEVGQAVSSTLNLQTVLSTIVSHADQLCGTDGGAIYEYDEATEELYLRATRKFEEALGRVQRGEGATGRAAATREPVQIHDVLEDEAYSGRLRELSKQSGFRAVLAVPLLREDRILGALLVVRKSPGAFPSAVTELLKTFATQSALAIHNARLFREIEDKGRQLEMANRHKSEFLANMSHELRTPLNAIIGFSEVLQERMFGDMNGKQTEYINDIHGSGKHLLSLINDILDLSKIEAGRMELDLTRFHVPSAISNALTLMRERASRHFVSLSSTVDGQVGEITADERKFKQILLNLLSNGVKFTPEGGKVDVRARQLDGSVEIAVVDTGVGIARADHAAVFEEFRQLGTDYTKKAEGTGLGLALTRRFVELHGGSIRLESEPGMGSTFTFILPDRADLRA